MARPSPSRAHDDDRLRLLPASSPQNSEAGKKESKVHRLSQLCPPCATPSSKSSLDHRRSVARIAENGFAANTGVSESAKVVLGLAPVLFLTARHDPKRLIGCWTLQGQGFIGRRAHPQLPRLYRREDDGRRLGATKERPRHLFVDYLFAGLACGFNHQSWSCAIFRATLQTAFERHGRRSFPNHSQPPPPASPSPR